jgi:NTP pyrophosphatase (non-canonical NTP hydrolase)
MSKLHLKKNPTISDFQKYSEDMVKERGFDKETTTEVFMLLTEELGELAKAIRKNQGIHTDKKSKEHSIDHEMADVFVYMLDLCNHLNIDLEKAFRDKEEINKKRVWTQNS